MEFEKENIHKGSSMRPDRRSSDEDKAVNLAGSVRTRLAAKLGSMVSFAMDIEGCETLGPYVALLVSPSSRQI